MGLHLAGTLYAAPVVRHSMFGLCRHDTEETSKSKAAKEAKMVTYIALIQWTEQGIKNVQDTVKREREFAKAAEKVGGRIVGTWYVQGEYDLVAVSEWPDDETANAFALALAKAGNARTRSSRAYSPEEMQRILDKMP
jgi:uncharacterized protein with GYD domain